MQSNPTAVAVECCTYV